MPVAEEGLQDTTRNDDQRRPREKGSTPFDDGASFVEIASFRKTLRRTYNGSDARMPLRRGLIAVGVPAEQAQKAAEEVAAYKNRIAGVEGRLSSIEARLQLWRSGGLIGANAALACSFFP